MYKYMPLRKVFFDNFLIRASQRCALNDPFEVLPSKSWLDKAYYNHYKSEHCSSFDKLLSSITKLNLNSMGIISLTSRPDNLLMWSHYANDHKGMVIEIDDNNSEFRKKFGASSEHPITQNVIYRKDRLKNFEDTERFLPYLYKSIEWAYEEEQRIIVHNLHSCDFWMCVFNNHSEAKEAFDKKECFDIQLNKCDLDENIIKFKTNDIKQPFSPQSIVNNPRFMSMFQIPTEAIKSVSFGVNADDSEVQEICEYIESMPSLKHIVKQRLKLDESVFGIVYGY
ncbi:MAG: hypothetical protein ACJAXS_003562 [Colwellia sp.]|jgi:hypothetical protein